MPTAAALAASLAALGVLATLHFRLRRKANALELAVAALDAIVRSHREGWYSVRWILEVRVSCSIIRCRRIYRHRPGTMIYDGHASLLGRGDCRLACRAASLVGCRNGGRRALHDRRVAR